MFLDARRLPPDHRLEADVCVVGGGAAGIALAHRLGRHELRVLLVEAGGPRPTGSGQRLLKAEIAGEAHRPLENVRSLTFGGTTHLWKGGCVPLESIDFEEREWLPHSGWPMDRVELETWYRRAAALCGVGQHAEPPLDGLPERLATRVVQYSPFPRFGEHFREALERAPGVSVCLGAHLVRIRVEAGRGVGGLDLATPGGQRMVARARHYVLATGGIENARLLLISAAEDGVRNPHELIGRFYATHPRILKGVLRGNPETWSRCWASYTREGVRAQTELHLSEATMRSEQLLNLAAVLIPSVRQVAGRGAESLIFGAQALRRGYLASGLAGHLRGVVSDLPSALGYARRRLLGDYPPRRPAELCRLQLQMEQAPNPDSRVGLSERRDALGLRRARLEWRPLASDWASAARSVEILREQLRVAGLGELESPFADNREWRPFLMDTAHHLGTTRMHDDSTRGVVDRDCRLHSIDNLYVAGSSVFPTAGVARPTLTIVALALRLADHLAERLGRPEAAAV